MKNPMMPAFSETATAAQTRGGILLAWQALRREPPRQRSIAMSVTKVIELNASSANGIEDAVKQGLKKASSTVKNIKGVWINEIKAATDDNGGIREWRVNMRINFVVD